ncbi:MAG TPA: glycosyltransferase family 4 protein, partial [Casimicrobiaceae bacterium]|nr:glycosyltransferase family 4 protein [Casimicrobiaceae bacterium]
MAGAMRILMAVAQYPFPVAGGLERQAHELALALVRRGHDVHALSTRFAPGQGAEQTLGAVAVHRIAWSRSRALRFAVQPLGLARAMLRLRRRIDVVHVHNVSWFGAWVTLLAQAEGLPVLTKLPNIGAWGIPGMRAAPCGALRVRLLARSDAIAAMTRDSVNELAAIGYPPQRVLRVVNGIAVAPPTATASGATPVVVVFAGRLAAEKGLPDLLHAWRIVAARASRPVRLRLMGEGPQAPLLRDLSAGLGIDASVELAGHCTDVAAQLRRAHVFVLPSLAEGNSNAILEAMSAALPVVATRVG